MIPGDIMAKIGHAANGVPQDLIVLANMQIHMQLFRLASIFTMCIVPFQII